MAQAHIEKNFSAFGGTVTPQTQLCAECGNLVEPADRFCPSCGTERAAAPDTATAPQTHFSCGDCGSRMSADPEKRSYLCPFCDSSYVVEFAPEAGGKRTPDYVIGFAITKEQAQERFKQWISDNSWFRPANLSRQSALEKLKGVYLPFWSFSTLAVSRWSASVAEFWYRTETYMSLEKGKLGPRTRQVRETEWWSLSGNHHRYYSGNYISASRGLPHAAARQIMPFNLAARKRYEPYFLAGWLCEEYSVECEEAQEQSLAQYRAGERVHVAAFMPGDGCRELEVNTEFSRINSDLCLLPIYVLSYRYQDKVFRFLINGQTGKYYGDKPISKPKIAAAIIVCALIAAYLLMVAIWAGR